VSWIITLPNGKTVNGSNKTPQATWDGTGSDNNPAPDGVYTAMVMAKTSAGNCSDSKTAQVTVKSSCNLNIAANKSSITPYSGGDIKISGDITDSSGNPINWTITLPGKQQQPVTGDGNQAVAYWDGKTDGKIQTGTYKATITAKSSETCSKSVNVPIIITPSADNNTCGLQVQVGSSANVANGNLTHSQALFSSKGSTSLDVTLYYNSLDPHNGSLGSSWSYTYDVSLKENSDGSVLITEPNWKYQYFILSDGSYAGQPGNYSTLVKNADGSFTLTAKDGQVSAFSNNGTLTSITDRNGNTQTFTYSGANLSTVTDSSSRTVGFAYDGANHLTAITDPAGNSYSLSVGTTLNSVTQPDGGTWQYSYDANAYMLTKTDPLGSTTTYTYDNQHRVVTSADPEGKTRSIAYPQTTDTVKSTTFTEKDGGTWGYSYDTQAGTLMSKTDPQGGVTSYAYDANGNRTSTTNPDATTTSATYDNRGNMLTSTDALGLTTSYAYNNFGQVMSITDPQGGTTAYAYDAKGNMISLTDPAGATTSYAYDAKGNVTKVTDPAGQATSFAYDAQGNLATVTDASGATTSYAYDAAGNVVSITDPKGGVTRFAYDVRNRLAKTIDPQSNVTLYTYDANGNKLSETDANGNVTRFEYNSRNQLIKTIDALGNITTYSYGGSSCPSCGGGSGEKLTSLTDANSNITGYEYDQLGRLVKETDPKGNVTSYAYDARNNLASKTDANGATITYSYDANNRLLKKTYPDNTEEAYTYNVKGNILTATNKDIAYTFGYNVAGRMLSSTDSNGQVLQYSYDNTGRKTNTTYPDGSIVSYAYDGTGRLASITNGGGRTYGYSYDKLGRRTKLSYPNETIATYSYDTAGRLTNLTHKQSNGRTIASFAYTLDKVGNRLTKAEPDGRTSYTYDAIYRLLKAQPNRHDGLAEAYGYDAVGNRLSGPEHHTTYTYGPGNELLKRKHTEFSYDKNGNMIVQGRLGHDGEHHDNEGHHYGKDNGWTYTYDFENRLIKAEKKRGHESTTVTYKYDPFGRRIEKRVREGEHFRDEDEVIYTYVYDGQAIILEYEAKGEGHHHSHVETTKYVHGPNIDEPLSMTRDNEVYYYHADGLGSIVALTDKRQKIVESYAYDSFGNLKQEVNKTKTIQPFTYTGREWDKETGLYYYRARYYDPMEGRFIQKDPIGFEGGDVVLYGYVQNNPVKRKDAYGLAYFAKRPLDGWPWLGTNTDDNRLNTELVHEQLFFEDGEPLSNIGYFKGPEGEFHVGLLKSDSPKNLATYKTREGGYDDCVMRKAYKKVTPLPYFELGFNCQAWADAVRKEYWKLYNSTK